MFKKTALVTAVLFMLISILISGIRLLSAGKFQAPAVAKLGKETAMIFAEQAEENSWPISDGTFIQSWLVKDWDDEKWTSELNILKESGMNYLVLTPTAIFSTDEKSGEGVTSTIYPTKIDSFKAMQENGEGRHRDVVDTCLRNAEKVGIKVFLGLNFSDEWWSKRRDVDWIFARMREGNEIADELWYLYHDKYPNAFYGWYWCWEVDNAYFRNIDLTSSKKILASAIKIHIDHFDAVDRHLPFMLAPYMNWRYGTPGDYAKMWEYVFENSGLKDGDIFCPQDSIGAGGLNRGNYIKWFSEIKKAIDKSPGIRLWADIETFDINDWTAVPINDIVGKMQELEPYVDNFITFAYSHYYSPNIVNSGFHEAFMNYVESGELESTIPNIPEGIRASVDSNGVVLLKWDYSNDTNEVCGYYIYRDGKLIANNQVNRKENERDESRAATSLSDTPKGNSQRVVYQVQAYDFAGNLSEKSQPLEVILR